MPLISAMHKTRWCDFYWRSHGCRHGRRCQHAHDIADYRGGYDRWVQYYIDRGRAWRVDDDGNPVDTSDSDDAVDAADSADAADAADAADPPAALSADAAHSADSADRSADDLPRILPLMALPVPDDAGPWAALELADDENQWREHWADAHADPPDVHADPPQDAFVGVGTVAPPLQDVSARITNAAKVSGTEFLVEEA